MEKLDAIDRKILFELDKNARIPTSKLAKIVRKSREAVKYRIAQLEKKGIIEKYITSINPNKLGYEIYKIYLQLENIPEERERFYNYLKNNDRVYWMGICDGVWDCIFAIYAKDPAEFYEIKNTIVSEFKHLIIKKETGTLVDVHQYPKKFLTGEIAEPVVFAGDVIENKIDELDQKIMGIIVNDARLPTTEIAKKANSTVEIVINRIRKMEKNGIILGYRISIDLNKLGLEFFKAIIYLKSLSKKEEDSLYRYMYKHPKSAYYIRSITPWEVEFEFVVESYVEFNKIINDLRKSFPNVIRNYESVLFIYESWLPGMNMMFGSRGH